jgi:hypothetical protein
MKLQYTEFRPSVNRSEVTVIGDANTMEEFRDAILTEVKVCMDYDSTAVAHKLLDWYSEFYATDLVPGAKLEYSYGGGRDPKGTWEIIA